VQDVQAGSSFSAALQKNPQQFDSLFCNLIYAGEQSGCLELMLENIAVYKERLESLKSKVKKALIYPVAVIAIALIITVILLLFVVPQFKAIFQSFGAPLPALTCAVIAISDFIFHYGWLLLLIAFTGFIGLLHYWKRSEKFRLAFDKAQLKIPIIGQILTKAAIARFARTLSITFAAGLPLADALLSVAGTTGNLLYQQATGKIQAEVATGQQLGRAMQLTQLFPTMTLQMVTIGEESGTLDKMLAKVADFYEAEVNNAVDSLSSLLEPMIMVILGVLIGSLVVALYLPIFKLGSVIG